MKILVAVIAVLVCSSASSSLPSECLTVTNLTDPSRLDTNGRILTPGGPHSEDGFACDLRTDLAWFRFAGAAGHQMLNTCPETQSCGTKIPYWTNDTMPTAVGVATKVTAYGVDSSNNCHAYRLEIEVIKCSLTTDYDFIYRQPHAYFGICNRAFCGMS